MMSDLAELLLNDNQVDYPCQSRVHRLSTFDTERCTCYVKRDDELGFGMTGTKVRKYRSLIPFLLKERFDEVLLIGGINSNNILGLVQLLIENRIQLRLFLRGDPARPLVGNGLLSLMLAGKSAVRWVSSIDWPNVGVLADAYAKEQDNLGKRVFVVPEGALTEQALPGTLTLALDIQRNEAQVKETFDHILIDSGTGLSAIALLLGLEYAQKPNHVHILLLADDEATFNEHLQRFHESFKEFIHRSCLLPHRFSLYHPQIAPSFGSVNAQILQEIRDVARQEGILLDPVYSAKLFLEARRILAQPNISGNALIVHGGGALALAGFQSQLNPQAK